MDTVTYPDSEVRHRVAEHYAPLKINLLDRHPDFKEVTGGTRVPWAPTIIFADPKGREVRRYVGWLPPGEFLAELRLAQAVDDVGRGRFAEGEALLGELLEAGPDSHAAPEALYWRGIAAFLAGKRDMAGLAESWRELVERHPRTRFATHASVIEDWEGN